MKLNLQRKSGLPLYRQITNQLRDYIRSGVLPPGDQLPTVRQLANEYKLTRLTVQTAYAELQAEGLVESVVGRGTFVANRSSLQLAVGINAPKFIATQPQVPWYSQGLLADMLRMTEQPNIISFAQASPAPETFPLTEFKKVLGNVLSDPTKLSYISTQGELTLREQIAHLLLDRGIVTPPERVLVVSGAQQGLDIALKTFVQPHEIIVMEEPSYPGALELAAQRGQKVIGLPRYANGFSLETLEQICQLYKPNLLYTIPTFHNPTGTSLSDEQKQGLLSLASKYNLRIIEDDTYGFLPLTDQPIPKTIYEMDESGERVIYLTSFSKSLMPSLRLGAIVASEANLLQLTAAKRISDLNSSSLLQLGLAEYLHRYSFGVHVQTVKKIYKERCAAMLSALEQNFRGFGRVIIPEGGLSIWVELPQEVDEREFYLEAIARGVGVAPGSAFFTQPQRQAYMRLSFGALTLPQIEQGVEILGKLLQGQIIQRSLLLARSARATNVLV